MAGFTPRASRCMRGSATAEVIALTSMGAACCSPTLWNQGAVVTALRALRGNRYGEKESAMSDIHYTSKRALQPRMPITSRIASNVQCPYCQEHGLTAGPNFVLIVGQSRRCGRCLQELPQDPDLPVHGSVALAICNLMGHGFRVKELVEEQATACDTTVQQHRLELERENMAASVRWFEIEHPIPLVGPDWRSWLPHPGQVWSMGLGDKLLKQGLPATAWSVCQNIGLHGDECAFKLTDRRLARQVANDQLFLRLEHRSQIGFIPGCWQESVILVARVEFTW